MMAHTEEKQADDSKTNNHDCNDKEDEKILHITDDKDVEKAVSKPKSSAPDGGWGWCCVFGCSAMHMLLGGTDRTYGLIYLDLLENFDEDPTFVAGVGGVSTAIRMGLGPIGSLLSNRFGTRPVVMAGGTLVFVAVLISGFPPSIGYMYLSWGVLFGFGGSLVYAPSFITIGQYFDKRRAIANGFATAGAGLGTFTIPVLYNTLRVSGFAFFARLMIMAAVSWNLIVCGALYRPLESTVKKIPEENEDLLRINSTTKIPEVRKVRWQDKLKTLLDYTILKNGTFMIFSLTICLTTMCYMPGYIFVPAIATERGLTKSQASILIAVCGITDMVTRLIAGFFYDYRKIRPIRRYIYALTPFLIAFGILLFPLVNGFIPYVMAAAYLGFTVGMHVSQIASLVSDLIGRDRLPSGIGFLTSIRGMGILIGPLIGGSLKKSTGSYDVTFYSLSAIGFVGGILFVLLNIHHFIRTRGKKEVPTEGDDQPDGAQKRNGVKELISSSLDLDAELYEMKGASSQKHLDRCTGL